MQKKVLAIVLAGGEGKRLMPLTLDRAKPAVPFGGIYRLIDFALSNIVNSGYLRVVVLTQYKSHSLDKHVAQTWRMSRSEEHTSELQSRGQLVCRLLLAKQMRTRGMVPPPPNSM